MIQLCWSHSVECKMATRSYLGFTVKATKPKLRFMRPLCNIQLFFFFFLFRILYNSPAYLSPRVSACTTWTRNSTSKFCITLVMPLKATAVSLMNPMRKGHLINIFWIRHVSKY